VHVQGVSFEKEQKVALEGLESLTAIGEQKAEEKKPAENMPVEFEGEPTPAEEHEPTAADLEMKAEKNEETVSEEAGK